MQKKDSAEKLNDENRIMVDSKTTIFLTKEYCIVIISFSIVFK